MPFACLIHRREAQRGPVDSEAVLDNDVARQRNEMMQNLEVVGQGAAIQLAAGRTRTMDQLLSKDNYPEQRILERALRHDRSLPPLKIRQRLPVSIRDAKIERVRQIDQASCGVEKYTLDDRPMLAAKVRD